ncbi:MAG TPA: NifB/NifX family molybdenum-iron cluster-binding protein [Tenuifilaceae bacterium]|nr:NifB/NifX family molybdenum-iron cluster-binding protein [Tenuifilaceae bacterium]
MKIAVPTRENCVDEHFGHCEQYAIFTVENGVVVKKESLQSPEGCGCKSNIAADLQQIGVTVMLAGGMGLGAQNVLAAHGIAVVRGCSGNVDELVSLYLKGNVTDSGESCSHHHGEGGHVCNH